MAVDTKKVELCVTKPDATFARYRCDQFRKSKSAKSVPYESLDFSIYKSTSNCVAFLTNEDRLIKWIEAIYKRYHVQVQLDEQESSSKVTATWEELQSTHDPAKTDKISVNLSLENGNILEHIVTILIYCTTGRIQIQGKSLRQWGDIEFNALLNMVDGKHEDKDLDDFIEAFANRTPCESKITNDNSKMSPKTEPELQNKKICSENTAMISDHSTESPRSSSFSVVKLSVATLESEFVLFKQETLKTFENIKITIKEKDDQISDLRQRVASLESTNELLRNEGSDLKSLLKKQSIFEKKINKLLTHTSNQKEDSDPQTPSTPDIVTKDNQPLTTEKSDPISQSNSETECNTVIPSTTPTEEQPLPSTYTVTTSNMFDPLSNIDESSESPTGPKKTITAETIILCDSNGRYLDTKLLCPNSDTQYIRCPTIHGATKILDEYQFTSPQTFVIHSGTNDIENTSYKDTFNKLTTLTTYITTKHPKCRILLSSLLPRSDHLLQQVQMLNSEIKKIQSPNIVQVNHDNLFKSTNILYDKKHLNQKGVKLFAKNLKGAYFAKTRNNKPKQQQPHGNLLNHRHRTRVQQPRKSNPPFQSFPSPSFPSPSFHPPPPRYPNPPKFLHPQPHHSTAFHHPNETWANTVPKPKVQSESLPIYLKDLINILHGFIH